MQFNGEGILLTRCAVSSDFLIRTFLPISFLSAFLNQHSPLFSASMMELTKPQRTAVQDDDPFSGVTGGGDDEEEAGGIANMRVVNASKVVKGRTTRPCPRAQKHSDQHHGPA